MNGGSPRKVTKPPLMTPKATHARTPSRTAMSAGTPLLTAIFVITIDPNAITTPQDRSMPAVRMMIVWPMARVPITITCWKTSEKFSPVRKRLDWVVKKAQTRMSAISGPSWARRSVEMPGRARARASGGCGACPPAVAGCVSGCVTSSSLRWNRLRLRLARTAAGSAGRRHVRSAPAALAPAVLLAEGGILRGDALRRIGGDQVHAGVGVARRLLAAARRRRDRLDALRGHVLRVLLRRRVDHARLDPALDRVAAAVDGHEDEVLRVLAGRLQRVGAAEARGLVDGVDDVDAGILLEERLHGGLALGRLTERVGGADDLRVALLDPEALEEAVVAKHADRDAGGEVQHGDLGRDAELLRLRLRVLADELARLEVVRRVERVDRALRLRRRVQGDHGHARVARLLDRRHDRLRVGGHDEDALGALRRHVLERGDLARVVRVELPGRGDQVDVVLLRGLLGRLLHLHEERVRLRLGDEADGDLLAAASTTTAAASAARRTAVVVAAACDEAHGERARRGERTESIWHAPSAVPAPGHVPSCIRRALRARHSLV